MTLKQTYAFAVLEVPVEFFKLVRAKLVKAGYDINIDYSGNRIDMKGIALEPEKFTPTHMHIKSGRLYRVVGNGKIEAGWVDAVYYAAEDGVVIARPEKEFNDGRFKAL